MASKSEEQWAAQLTATSTEVQNNFGRYLDMVSSGKVIIVTRNGREVGRFVPRGQYLGFMTDQLRGMLHTDEDYDMLKEEELAGKYETDR